MRKYLLLLALILAASFPAKAQIYPNQYETLCPSGSFPISGPTGSTFNPTTGKYKAIFCVDGSGNVSSNIGASSGTISPLSFGAKFDVKFVYDAQWGNGTSTITCPQGDCAFTQADVGKIGFGVSDTNIGSTFGAGVTVPQFIITAVNSSTSITVNTTTTAACTPANSIPGALCNLAWGTQDDTTAINSAFTAAWTGNTGKCSTVEWPNGAFFFSSGLGNFTIAQLSSACGGAPVAIAISGIDTTQVGPMLKGAGMGTSVAIPLPNFNFGSCTGGSSSSTCNFGTPNTFIRDLSINGLGQYLNGSPHAVNLVESFSSNGGGSCTGATMENVGLAGWAAQSLTSVGLQAGAGCGDPFYENVIVERFGATNCSLTTGGINSASIFNGLLCLGASTRVLQINCSHLGPVDTFGSAFVDQNGGGPLITQTGCTWNSKGDALIGNINATALYQNNSGVSSTANIDGDSVAINSGATGFLVTASAGTQEVNIKNSTISQTGTAKLFSSNSTLTFSDDGHNTWGTAGTTASTITGSQFQGAAGNQIKGACTGVATASQTLGLYPLGGATTTCTSTTPNAAPYIVSGPRTLQHLVVTSTVGGVNASSGVVTVMKNSVATAITCTLGTGTACNDTLHYVSAVDSDLITIQFTTQAADTLAGVKAIVFAN